MRAVQVKQFGHHGLLHRFGMVEQLYQLFEKGFGLIFLLSKQFKTEDF
jgi:hypothetical protein